MAKSKDLNATVGNNSSEKKLVNTGWAQALGVGRDVLLPVAAISVVFVMLIPLPAPMLDVLIACSIAAAVLVFLTAVQVRKAVDLSVFPTLLLLLTPFRLSLNIASSRRILLHGSEGTHAAGSTIEAFGQFVVGGNYVVGFVLFLALIAIQFLVVSHGAVRTAEVTARFTLDALPGKQMAIDADLNAGAIDEATARKRREAVAREAEFYGAMDGAARFNQRDSMATILLTAINIVAGLLIGTLQQGVPLLDAVKTYTILTVGDGLVTMIPSLLVSVAGAIVLTRASSAETLSTELGVQLLGQAKTLYIASGVLAGMAFIPGLPKVAFVGVAIAAALLGKYLIRGHVDKTSQIEKSRSIDQPAEPIKDLLKLDELSLEIGFQLIPLVDEKQGGQLLGKVRTLRKHLATELGFLIPPVHISDNLRLKPREYVTSLRGIEIGRWQTEGNALLAVNGDTSARQIAGKETHEPAFGVPARWIQVSAEESAIAAGYAVVDVTTVIGTHLAELIRRNAHEVLTRTETKRLLDSTSETHPRLVEELVPKVMSLGDVQRVLQQLLREQVSIRDVGSILETLLDQAVISKNLVYLVEQVRYSMRRRLVQPFLEQDGILQALTIEQGFEQELQQAFSNEGNQLAAASSSQSKLATRLVDSLKNLIGTHFAMGAPVLLCSSPARYPLRRWLESVLPRLAILSPLEIPPDVRIRTLGVVR